MKMAVPINRLALAYIRPAFMGVPLTNREPPLAGGGLQETLTGHSLLVQRGPNLHQRLLELNKRSPRLCNCAACNLATSARDSASSARRAVESQVRTAASEAA